MHALDVTKTRTAEDKKLEDDTGCVQRTCLGTCTVFIFGLLPLALAVLFALLSVALSASPPTVTLATSASAVSFAAAAFAASSASASASLERSCASDWGQEQLIRWQAVRALM